MNKKNIEEIMGFCNRKAVDVTVEKINIEEIKDEIHRTITEKFPEYMIITIKKKGDLKKYHSTVYISKKDFKNKY